MASFHLRKRKQLPRCLCVGDDNFQDGDMNDGDCVVVCEKIPKRRRQQLDELIPAEINCGPEDDDVVVVLESIRTLYNQQNVCDVRTIVTFSEQSSSPETKTGVMTGCILDKGNDDVVRLPAGAAATSKVLEGSYTNNTGTELSSQNRQVFSEGVRADRAPVQWVPLQKVLQEGLSVFGPQTGTIKEQQELQNKQHQPSSQHSEGHTNQQQFVELPHMLQQRFLEKNQPTKTTLRQEKQLHEGRELQQQLVHHQLGIQDSGVSLPQRHFNVPRTSESSSRNMTQMTSKEISEQVTQETRGMEEYRNMRELHDTTYQQTSQAPQQPSGHYGDISAMRQEQQQNRQVFSEGVRADRAPVQWVPLQKVLQEGLSVFGPQTGTIKEQQELQNKQHQPSTQHFEGHTNQQQFVELRHMLQQRFLEKNQPTKTTLRQEKQLHEGRELQQQLVHHQLGIQDSGVSLPQRHFDVPRTSESSSCNMTQMTSKEISEQVTQETRGMEEYRNMRELHDTTYQQTSQAPQQPSGHYGDISAMRQEQQQNRQVFSEGVRADRAPVQWVPLQKVLQEGLSVFGPQTGTIKEQQELQNKQHQPSTQHSEGHTNQQQFVELRHMLQQRILEKNQPTKTTLRQEKQLHEGRELQQQLVHHQLGIQDSGVSLPQRHFHVPRTSESSSCNMTQMTSKEISEQVTQETRGMEEYRNMRELHDTTYQQTSQAPQQPSGHYGDISAMRQEQQLTKLMGIARDFLAPLLPKVMQQQCQEDSVEAEFTLSLMNTFNATGASAPTRSPSSASLAPLGAESAGDETEDSGAESFGADSGVHAGPAAPGSNAASAAMDEQSQDGTNNGNPAIANNNNDAANQQPKVNPLKCSEQNSNEIANPGDLRLPDDEEKEISDTESMCRTPADSPTTHPSSTDTDNSVSDFTGASAEKDVVPLGNVIIEESRLPPLGIVNHPPVAVGSSVYVMNDIRDPWNLGRVKDIRSQNNQTMYTVEYVYYKNKKMKKKRKEATGFQLAYPKVQDFRLPVGHRIISIFRDRNYEEYYSGVIAETPKSINQYRYLIFFDNGSTQYVKHEDIRLVVDSSQSVLEDVPVENGEFVQNYLEKYPERAMLKVQEGQYVSTEHNGVWYNAKVLQVDASLAQMAFPPKGKYVEWIYRGSPRFYQLFEARKRTCRKQFARTKAFARKICNPFIQYTVKEDEELHRDMKGEHEAAQELEQSYNSTARINTSSAQYRRLSSTVESPKRKCYLCYSEGTYKPHRCNPSCMVALSSVKDYRSYRNLLSHLSEPLFSGWTREKVKHSDSVSVYYRAPCKLRLRNIEEVHKYLLETKSKLTVDQFDFNHRVRCFSEVVNEECFVKIEDISKGIEAVPIPCINTIDTREPDKITYVTKHVPTSGTYIETDPEFLTCCDCTDDCLDKEKCACWRQTMEGVKYGQEKGSPRNEGYYYKRLFEPLSTAIYECNSRCKCSSTCLNRLVQLPMKCKTQVFMTPDRGWGVRTLHDVPKGSYICLYAGLVLSEKVGDIVGKEAGDEYQADLNYIEDAEGLKETYEENPYENELGNVCHKRSNSKRKGKTKTSRKLSGKMYKIVAPPTRVLFGQNERYILDAKACGNVGRFINHSCNPNLFVQNVFVDTHDLRFPYVAFFTNTLVPANTELTWNYGYDVGSVPGRIIICKCGEKNCQGRLL